MDQTLKQIAAEVAPQIENELTNYEMFGDPEWRDKLITVLWDNKVGILRVLQAVAQN